MKFRFGTKKKAADTASPIQEPENEHVVLNMDRLQQKNSGVGAQPSFSTDKPKVGNVDDMSLSMVSENYAYGDGEKSLNLDALKESESIPEADADSQAFSESANSSAHFSFSNESTSPNADNYPALYAPEKQKEYEEMKALELKKEKYGVFHPLAPVLDFVTNGASKIYGSISAYLQKIEVDKLCGGASTATK